MTGSDERVATRRLLDGLDFSVAVLDDEGVIVETNEAWATFGERNDLAGPPDSVGTDYLAVCGAHADDPFASAAREGLAAVLAGDRESFRLEYPCHSPDQKRWFLLYAGGLADGGAIVAHLDVTDRKVSELAAERRAEDLEALAGMLSHDLRSPLGVARGWLSQVEPAGDGTALERVRSSLERMDRLVEDALTFARAGRQVDDARRRPVDVGRLAEEAWQTVETGDATLEVVDSATVECDPGLLTTVLENLFRNAVEHGSTGPGSTPHEDAVEHDSTSPASQPRQDADEHVDGVTVRVGTTDDGFYVADDGPGVDEADAAAIFEFGHSGAGGSGFGLAIVRTIVEAHGWSVDVDPAADGARFVVDTRPARSVDGADGDERDGDDRAPVDRDADTDVDTDADADEGDVDEGE